MASSLPLLLLGLVNAAVHADDTWAPDRHRGSDIVSIGHDSILPSGQQADSVVSIFGSSTSAGDAVHVVSILGNTRVTGTVRDAAVAVVGNVFIDAKVEGDAIAVVGSVELGPHAEIDGNVVSVLGSVRRDPAAIVHGGVQSIFTGDFGNFEGLHAWLTHCLLYVRPLSLSAGLGWAWGLALGFLALYAILAVLASGAVRRCVHTFETRPGQTLLASILAMLLWPVLIVLLGVTLIGIAAVPFVVTAVVCAVLFGKAVMLAWLGGRMTGGPKAVGALGHPAFAVVVGGAVVLALYLVPVLGFLVFNLLGILGFGAVAYTLILTLRVRQATTGAPFGAAQAGAGTAWRGGSAVPPDERTATRGGSAAPTDGTTAAFGGSAVEPGSAAAPFGASAAQRDGTVAPFGGSAVEPGSAAAPFGASAAQRDGTVAPFGGSAVEPGGAAAPFGASAAQRDGTVAPFGGSAVEPGGAAASFGASAAQRDGTVAPLGGSVPRLSEASRSSEVSPSSDAPSSAAESTATAQSEARGAAADATESTAAPGSATGADTAAAAAARAAAGSPAAPGATGTTTAAGTPPFVIASLPRAGFWIRMAALLIDVLLVGFAMSLLHHSSHLHLLVLGAYGAVMWRLRGATVGGIVLDLRVVRLDGRAIEWETAIVRALACFLSLAVAGLGFIWIAIDAGNQAWHDKIAGTVVVRLPKGAPLA